MPLELRFDFPLINSGRIDSNKLIHFTDINVSRPIEFLIDMDNYRLQKAIEIHPNKLLGNLEQDVQNSMSNRKFTVLRRVNFYDEKNGRLFLIGRIVFKIGSELSTTSCPNDEFQPYPLVFYLSAVYCFFNLTGLSLIFRQFNCDEASGQLDEHESVCNTQPLHYSRSMTSTRHMHAQ